jgi:hypothetical protein
MKQPQLKALVFFSGVLLVGYALAIPLFTAMLQMPLSLLLFLNVTAFAIIFAVVMTVMLDRPMELELFKWPEPKPKVIQPPAAPVPPALGAAAQSVSEPQSTPPIQGGEPAPGQRLFPHDAPAEHWDIDFSDSKQAYQGSDLPVWILAGWAIFIIWGILYLVAGLPTAF